MSNRYKKLAVEHDPLAKSMKNFYHYNPPGGFSYDMPELRTLQEIAARREGIRNGLQLNGVRRTYIRGHVWQNDDFENGRNVDHVGQIEHRNFEHSSESYSTTQDGDAHVKPFVMQLSGRHGREVWMYGFDYSDAEGVVVFTNTCKSRKHAFKEAGKKAEEEAERIYEDNLEVEKDVRIELLYEDLETNRHDVRYAIKKYRALRPKCGTKCALMDEDDNNGLVADALFEQIEWKLRDRSDTQCRLQELGELHVRNEKEGV
jgi:hypothetical protein